MVILLGICLNSHVTSSTNSVLDEAEDQTILIRSCLAVYERLVVSHQPAVSQRLVVCRQLV
jgi:hypothetical protein